uniref:Uncharacterized protein n=1 Tax=Arundo donax TaxID=35708 RepID=A0A0A8ZWT9_ARUDO
MMQHPWVADRRKRPRARRLPPWRCPGGSCEGRVRRGHRAARGAARTPRGPGGSGGALKRPRRTWWRCGGRRNGIEAEANADLQRSGAGRG